MSQDKQDVESEIPKSLDKLEMLLDSREHLLAVDGDEKLAEGARQATKDVFDLAISLESQSHPHLHPFLVSILQPPSIGLRSATRAQDDEEPKKADPTEVLPYTPLSVLTVDGLDPEQIWAQLELRNEGVCKVVKEVGAEEAADMDEDEEDGEDESDSEEMGSDEEMSIEEWNKMMAEGGYEEGDSASGSEDEWEGIASDEDEDMDDTVEFEDGTKIGESDSDLEGESGDDDEEDDEDEDDEDEEDDDEEDDDDEEEEEEDDDDDMTGNPDVDMDDDDVFPAAGPSRKKAKHPTLDDQFFSIDDFNRMTEEQEAERVTSGALGGEEDDEPELDDFGSMFLSQNDEPADINYSDFFAPPPRTAAPTKGKGKATEKPKKKKKAARFEESDKDEEPEEEEDAEELHGVMDRVKTDLFEESDDDGEEQALSTHEKRQRELAAQIAELEQQAIGPKDWTLMGEASSRARPENSLLEENLDFEHVAKVVPVITEESVATLEELIKKRILDGNFDSPVRVRAFEPTAFLPSRFFELDDKQSSKSLAQIYEDEFTAEASGGAKGDARDDKLKKEHDEIERLWDEVCYKLDALSSLNFVPKQPKAQITTIDNIATASMETALPAQQSATSMLAPQELFSGPAAADLQARSEQTPEEAKRARSKARKAKKATHQRLDATAKLYGKKKLSVREEKEAALSQLVKTGKGVTVLGKGAKEEGKKRKRDEGEQDGKRLKL